MMPGACEVMVTRGGRTKVKDHLHWHEVGQREAMREMLELVVVMLADGHSHKQVLHAVMHAAAAGEMLDRLDYSGDIENVVTKGWQWQ